MPQECETGMVIHI